MIVFEFRPGDLLRTRFAISPLNEAMQSVAALRDPASASIHMPWIRAARARLGGLDLSLLEALVPAGGAYQPDFASPPPRTPLPDVGEELDRVARATPGQIRDELRLAYPQGPPAVLSPLLSDPRSELPRVAGVLRTYWDRALAPWWDAIRHALEDDIAWRARSLTTGGALEVFGELHPDVRWREDRLEVERPFEERAPVGKRGLLLVPSAFVWPRCAALSTPPWQPALIYPARGVGTLWAPRDRDPEALAALIGGRRTAVLSALDNELSTTALARRLGASAAGVSEHLGVLRRAGLVRSRRQGREVLYSRTPAADTLLAAATRP